MFYLVLYLSVCVCVLRGPGFKKEEVLIVHFMIHIIFTQSIIFTKLKIARKFFTRHVPFVHMFINVPVMQSQFAGCVF